MDLNRNRNFRNKASRDPLERRMDQWIETGRQFVDGVAGNRPGQRRMTSIGRSPSQKLDKVGRWVGDKLDWFFEEEEDWNEPWESEKEIQVTNLRKKPLDAISRRVTQKISKSYEENIELDVENEWPDDSSFRVEKWQRHKTQTNIDNLEKVSRNRSKLKSSERRSLPRSSRRRG